MDQSLRLCDVFFLLCRFHYSQHFTTVGLVLLEGRVIDVLQYCIVSNAGLSAGSLIY